ncbi:peptidylprolyl isomerase [Leptolyngbya sp. FACHB-261]|nr:peptidylprolyl isomerase [Leptolyngbya sp. FACHB-261]
MTPVLQVNSRTVTAEEIVPLLASYQMLPRLLREIVIDQAIEPFSCTPEETALACQQFAEQNQITSEASREVWLKRYGMTPSQLEALAIRSLRIEKFKQAIWGTKLESYFVHRKPQLDRVIYSLLRVKDLGIAQELYFRIQEREQAFADLAREYSQGPEAQTGGLIGPAELSTPHPSLAQMLSSGQPGQLWPPTRLGEWFVLVRLEKLLPAQLDASMGQRLLNELYETWLQERLAQVSSGRLQNSLLTPTA